jgi:hypothetical protein
MGCLRQVREPGRQTGKDFIGYRKDACFSLKDILVLA